MPSLTAPVSIQLPIPSGTPRPSSDLLVPNYDRRNERGNYLVVSLDNGKINFSSYCPSFSRALAMTRLSKMQPTWIVSGVENELVILKKVCSMNADWLTGKIVDNLIKSQLGKTMQIVTTLNL